MSPCSRINPQQAGAGSDFYLAWFEHRWNQAKLARIQRDRCPLVVDLGLTLDDG